MRTYIYTIKLADGSVQTYTSADCQVDEEKGMLRIYNYETWQETNIPLTGVLYYRKEKMVSQNEQSS